MNQFAKLFAIILTALPLIAATNGDGSSGIGAWGIFALLVGGTLGVLVVASFVSSAIATYITSFFSWIIDMVKSITTFVSNNLPKPIKVVLFLVLFASVGGYLYTFTVGASYVCLEDEVHRVAITDGIALQSFPDFKFFREGRDDELVGSAANISNLQQMQDLPFVFVEQGVVDMDSGIRGDVTYLVTGVGEIQRDIAEIMRVDANVAWNEYKTILGIFGVDQISYNLCYDKVTQTCVLDRSRCAGLGSGQGFVAGSWNIHVGTLTYRMNNNNELGVRLWSVKSPSWTKNLGFLRQYALSDSDVCVLWDGDTENEQLTVAQVGIFQDGVLVVENVEYEGNTRNPFGSYQMVTDDIILYGATVTQVFATNQRMGDFGEGQTFFDQSYQLIGYESRVSELIHDPSPAIRGAARPHEQNKGDIVKFECDLDDPNQYKTKMTVMGINPFDPLVVAIIAIIGLLLGFISKLRKIFG